MSAGQAGGEFEEVLARVADGYAATFDAADDEQALRAANARWVGPQGELTQLLKQMSQVPKERRRELGQRANRLKDEIRARFEDKLAELHRRARQAELSGSMLDVSLPGRGPAPGGLHPLTQIKHEVLDIFVSFGFDIAEGPEIDWHEYNFDKLGFPPDHPATDMQDSFFVAQPPDADAHAVLLRTHTSTVQIREMLRRPPPLAVVSPGAVYRRDDDVTHSPMFLQIEGFLVDEGVTFSHLKGVLTTFVRRLFGSDTPVRFRPSYFPFVEPGGEVDMGCVFCRRWERPDAGDCRVCKNTGWLEILGCGMIHPYVFEQVGYDAERYTGFAFGLGIDRIAMLRHGIGDIRLMYENDPRFLSWF